MTEDRLQNESEDTRNYKLKLGENRYLEDLLLSIKKRKLAIDIDKVTITEEDRSNGEKSFWMNIALDPDNSDKKANLRLKYGVEPITEKEADTAIEFLKREYQYCHESGQHWDLLRWGVSRFFLSIQTVFVIVALTGLLELGKTDVATNKPIIDKSLVASGLIFFAIINIALCIIWLLRNTGIHAWHRAAIIRQQLIELDPRLRQMTWFISSIFRTMNMREGLRGKIHSTGELECFGPPIVFGLLWIGIIIITENYR